ncbi:hypothetical protein ORIO_07770 [Cereibacter azotoformans]|uniref:hypothetical protein n=1 Tax=Cereibacter azotoformans TaxID=43057 RepID=UPI001EEBA2D4|nr:hypothetical protein [Cereibacter azotoformans]ULB09812.1 hypothetical protein ORIO_07770 [Cereibacter azotoformans]
MGILTVRAPDSQQAMEEVLRRLGPEAYILSTTQRDGLVEIRAARDLPVVTPPAPRPVRKDDPDADETGDFRRLTLSGLSFGASREAPPLRREPRVQTFAEMLEDRQRQQARPALVAERTPQPPLPATDPDEGFEALVRHLLPSRPATLPPRLAIVGPAGAGKTMLALRFAALMMEERPGAEPVILAPRIGGEPADARLRHWTRLLAVPLERPPLDGIGQALLPRPDPWRPEILDLSCSPGAAPEALAETGAKVVLALPAGLSPRALRHWAQAPAGSLICLTRTDLWLPDGAELAALAASGLRLGWESGGTGVVDALWRVDADRLGHWVEAGEVQGEERS